MPLFNLDKEEILTPQDWGFPVPIAYGPGRIKEISTFCKNLNIQNPLIVTDSGSKDLPFIENLKKNGVFLAKCFKGGTEIEALSLMKKHFSRVHHIKPDASRKESVEGYVIALGYKT